MMAAAMQLERPDPDQLLTTSQAAALLGVSPATFRRLQWFKTRKVHPTDSRAPNAMVRYRAADVTLYMALRAGETRPLPRIPRKLRRVR